jgi:hypothetical protein
MIFTVLCWGITIISTCIGAVFLGGALSATAAPGQASAAAVALGFAVIPYCFTRAVSEIRRELREEPKTSGVPLPAATDPMTGLA